MTRSKRRPGTFWELTFHSNTPDMRHIVDYDLGDESFDHMCFLQGQRFQGRLPRGLRLWIEEGPGLIADQLGNALGWRVMSDRLVEHLWPLIAADTELLPAPLFLRGRDTPIDGYKIVNVLSVRDCVDIERSVAWFGRDGTIGGFYEVCIDPSRAQGVHMFKYVVPQKRVETAVICTFELVKSLEGYGFSGLAFLRCECAGE